MSAAVCHRHHVARPDADRCLANSPNYSLAGRNYTDPAVLAIGNVTDGIVDEAGFTFAKGYAGQVRATDTFPFVAPVAVETCLAFA